MKTAVARIRGVDLDTWLLARFVRVYSL